MTRGAPEQLPLAQLKQLAGRLLVVELLAAGSPESATSMRRLLEEVSTFGRRESERNEHLHEHIRKLVARMQDVGQALPQPARFILPVVTTADARSKVIDCVSCAGEHRRPCSREPAREQESFENIHERGHCIRPLKDQFALVLETMRWLVTSHLGASVDRTLHLSTGFSTTKPHHFSVPFAVGGSHNRSAGTVKLTFWLDGFDLDTYHAITYVLFHELFCHAWDGTSSAAVASTRRPLTEGEEFADGWMDSVAVRVLEAWLEGRLGPGAPLPPDAAARRRRLAQSFHAARLQPEDDQYLGQDPRPATIERQAGVEAAEELLRRLAMRFPTDCEQALNRMVGWSLYLCATAHPHRARLAYWRWFDQPGDERSEPQPSPDTVQLLDLICSQHYAEGWKFALSRLSNIN